MADIVSDEVFLNGAMGRRFFWGGTAWFWTDMDLRKDLTPRNGQHMKLVRGSHSWIWSALKKAFGFADGGRKYEVTKAFMVDIIDDRGRRTRVEFNPGFQFDGPTLVDLDGVDWWNPVHWVRRGLGLDSPWWRSWWLPLAAYHDRPYKNPERKRTALARLYVDETFVLFPKNFNRIIFDRAFRVGLLAVGEKETTVEIAYRVIREGGDSEWLSH